MSNKEITPIPLPPGPESLAAYVKLQRGILRWKQDTLAGMAKVSLSTVQRVERGDAVKPCSLDRLAAAFGLKPDAFTKPRIKLSEEDALKNLVDSFSWMNGKAAVKVSPLRTESQLRALASASMTVLDSDLGLEAQDDMECLREWIDLTGFIRSRAEGFFCPSLIGASACADSIKPDRNFRMRGLYGDVFDHVTKMEKRHRAVCLVGTYTAETDAPRFEAVDVAVISLRSKERNPAAATARTLWADKEVSWRTTWQAFMEQKP